MMSRNQIIGIALTILLSSCQENYTSINYIEKVFDNLNTIESASYNEIGEAWAPGDTAASAIYYNYIEEYNNPMDSTIGATFIKFNSDDTTKVEYCYDGKMRAIINDDEKVVAIDSFIFRKMPFRLVPPPFYNYTKSILKYILNNSDSTLLEQKDLGDDVYIKLTIFEEYQIEFFGKSIRMPYQHFDNNSSYEIWINKKDNLPYKIRREMFHSIEVTSVSNYKFNKLNITNFVASDNFPKKYEIRPYYRQNKKKRKPNELIGKKASDWTLQTSNKQTISLSELKSKTLMIQFTSVACGPCRASIPFLKKIGAEYKKEDFDFVAIECSSKSTRALEDYKTRNNFNYKFLLSTKDVLKDYSISSFPVFYILDENRTIKKVINGYGEGSTDKEIKAIINSLL